MQEKTMLNNLFLNLKEEFQTDTPYPLDFVLPGFLSGTVGALVSPGGMGKTMFALELATAAATGYDLVSFTQFAPEWKFKPYPVVYLSLEDPAEILVNRLKAISEYIGTDHKQQLLTNLKIGSLIGHPMDLKTTEGCRQLKTLADGARLVVLDTFRRFHSGDENSAKEMSDVLAGLEALCAETHCSILILHHTSKTGAQEFSDIAQASRGSSVLSDNVRFQMNLSGIPAATAKKNGISKTTARQYVQLTYSKVNYGGEFADQWYVRGDDGVLISVSDAEQNRPDFNDNEDNSEELDHEEDCINDQNNNERRSRSKTVGDSAAAQGWLDPVSYTPGR